MRQYNYGWAVVRIRPWRADTLGKIQSAQKVSQHGKQMHLEVKSTMISEHATHMGIT
jgi:hypothetical protein